LKTLSVSLRQVRQDTFFTGLKSWQVWLDKSNCLLTVKLSNLIEVSGGRERFLSDPPEVVSWLAIRFFCSSCLAALKCGSGLEVLVPGLAGRQFSFFCSRCLHARSQISSTWMAGRLFLLQPLSTRPEVRNQDPS
jgi:hypothetical protein